MQLRADCLISFLESKYKITKNDEIPMDFVINNVALWTDSEINSNTLYLSPAHKTVPADNVLYIVTDEFALDHPGWYLVCPESCIFQAVNECFRIWQGFLLWRENCRDLALVQHNLSLLLEEGARYLGVEIVVIDRDYRYDGGAQSGNMDVRDEFFGRTDDMDTSDIELLYSLNPNFDDTFHTDGLIYYPYYDLPTNGKLYYYNLRYDHLYLGRLIYRIGNDCDNSGLQGLMEGFSLLVSKCYEYYYLRKSKDMPRYSAYDTWKQLLEGKTVDRELAELKLSEMRWKTDHRYCIMYITSNGYFRSQETLKFYAVQLELAFQSCIAAQVEEGIYMLNNLDQEENPNFRQDLSDFLRENLMLCGISNIFNDFYDSRRYAHQAKDALKLGKNKHPQFWKFEFRDYQSDYIMQQCLSRYTARDLCPQELMKLLCYDEQHPEMELTKTLEIYYHCKFNAAEAAKQLFIHRTTLFYRLNKIQQIANINHNDPNIRLQILLSFAMMQEENKNQV